MFDPHPYYTGIQNALLDDASEPTAATLADERIHADQLPNDPKLPAVRLAILTDLPHQRLSNGNNITADVQVDVYVHRGDAHIAWPIDEYIRRVLDRQNLTVTGFAAMRCMLLERGKPRKEDGFFRIISRYRLYGSAS